MFYRFAKRTMDVLVSGFGLLLISPILLVAGIGVLVTMGPPAFFRQPRAGLHGKPFSLLKLRTMRDAVGPDGEQLPDAERLTAFGSTLRRFSIDELPQLLNVLAGQMSLVGPRPLLMEYLPLYSPEQARRHDVKPGITGYAQIGGRNTISWEERFALDVRYVDECSLAVDLGILWKTLFKVSSGEGVQATGEVTMPRFMGSASAAADEGGGPTDDGRGHDD